MKVKDPFLPVALIIVLVLVAGAYYYWTQYQHEAAPPAPPAPETEKAEPEKRYPIENIAPPASPEEAAPLPPLRESDATLHAAGAKLIGAETLERYFNLKDIARRFVVTVEELPRRKVGNRYNLAKPVAGDFVVNGKEGNLTLSAANYKRYTSYVVLAETVPTDKLVALYVRFYPLLQEEYKTLGYPKRYFNDRVVETIDDLLATPEIQGPIKLTQPKVMYEFADPNLEKLSAGQKIMIRMGAENAAKVKAKLREIRAAITTAVR
jgi:Protein of unknown function (DUF3014)